MYISYKTNLKLISKMYSLTAISFFFYVYLFKDCQISAYPTNSLERNCSGQCHDFDPKALVQYRHSKKKHGIISWTQSAMNSYVLGGMTLSKEKYLLLPSEGYYDVQTRLQMDTYTLDLQPSRETPVRLAVNVMEENGHIRTLMEEKFILGPKQMFGKQLGPTMFYLSKGSAVYVVINAHDYINPNKHSMFNIRKWSN